MVEAATDQACAIRQAFHIVQVVQQHYRHTLFQFQVMWRRARRVQRVQKLHRVKMGLVSLLSSVSTEVMARLQVAGQQSTPKFNWAGHVCEEAAPKTHLSRKVICNQVVDGVDINIACTQDISGRHALHIA